MKTLVDMTFLLVGVLCCAMSHHDNHVHSGKFVQGNLNSTEWTSVRFLTALNVTNKVRALICNLNVRCNSGFTWYLGKAKIGVG